MRLIHSKPLILASASPRREEICRQIGLEVEIRPSRVEEFPHSNERVSDYARRVAFDKAADVARNVSSGIVIGVDTDVVADGEILGKPKTREEARAMLQKLSGREHHVVSGLAVIEQPEGRKIIRTATTAVRFKILSREEIDAYVATGEPMDKAGAYGIQGQAGLFVESITGCYYNVVGLPANLLYETLLEFGVRVSP